MKSWTNEEAPLFKDKRRKEKTPAWRWVVSFLVLGLIIFNYDIPKFLWPRGTTSDRNNEGSNFQKPFRWDAIEAKETLEFHPCFNTFECAKLKLPLDYVNGTHSNETISVAIAKLPAIVSVDDPRYAGPILINPGGPGGPGALAAQYEGPQLQKIVDSPLDPSLLRTLADKQSSSARYYDIIGFDPRGVGETRPLSACFPDDATLWAWSLRETEQGIIESSDAAMGRLWYRNQAWATSCSQVVSEDEPDIKQYMTTAFVARDMLEIVERHSEYVSEKATKLFREDAMSTRGGVMSAAARQKPEDTKLQYLGFSYGTYLGATFASMFPDRVGRVVLDGVVNSDDYNYSLGNGSLHDAEKAMKSFYTYCLASGPDECPLATSTSSLADIESRTQSIIQSLYHHPLPIVTDYGPEVLTYTDVKLVIFSALYQPLSAFPIVSQLLAAVEAGSGKILDQFAMSAQSAHVYRCPANSMYSFLDVAVWAVLCADGDPVSDTMSDFQEYWNLLNSTSPTSGSIWTINRMKCTHWKIRPSYRYTGQFGGITSHPILWLSNTADPVTPLRSARIMSERFPGSVVLTQDAAGHCVCSRASPCAVKHLRNYFQTGELPEPNTICIPPKSPFSLNSTEPSSPFYDDSVAYRPSMEVDDIDCATTSAAEDLQSSFKYHHHFGPMDTKRVEHLF